MKNINFVTFGCLSLKFRLIELQQISVQQTACFGRTIKAFLLFPVVISSVFECNVCVDWMRAWLALDRYSLGRPTCICMLMAGIVHARNELRILHDTKYQTPMSWTTLNTGQGSENVTRGHMYLSYLYNRSADLRWVWVLQIPCVVVFLKWFFIHTCILQWNDLRRYILELDKNKTKKHTTVAVMKHCAFIWSNVGALGPEIAPSKLVHITKSWNRLIESNSWGNRT